MLPTWMPKVKIAAKAPRGLPSGRKPSTVRSLCRDAGIECRVTGPSTERKIYLCDGLLDVVREPGSLGAVSIRLPCSDDKKKRAILALGILAYAVFDYVARESMRGRPEARQSLPLGRPRKAHPLSGAERQRRWRETSRK
jgi:hypothetical protein